MRKDFFLPACLSLSAFLLTACISGDEKKIAECAENFTYHYFNLDFDKASKHCTPESMKWIAFKASNITRKDIEASNNRAEDLQIQVESIKILNDSSANAHCLVRHAIDTDSLEQRQINSISRKEWGIQLVKRNKRWFVKMEAPLQNAE